MTGTVAVGNAEIPYSLRYSRKAQKKRIEITLEDVKVIAPEGCPEDEVHAFVEKKRDRIYVARERIRWKARELHLEKEYFFSGAKVLFRGRRLLLVVRRENVGEPTVMYRNRFYVTIPLDTHEDAQEKVVQKALEHWLKERLSQDATAFANTFGNPFGLEFRGIRIRQQKNIWATCGKDGYLYLNWTLIHHPRKLLEYVIAHEVAHLKHRNHSEEFWTLVGSMVAGYKEYQRLLDAVSTD